MNSLQLKNELNRNGIEANWVGIPNITSLNWSIDFCLVIGLAIIDFYCVVECYMTDTM